MKARAIPTVLVPLLLGFGAPAGAQDMGAEDAGAKEPPADEAAKPKRAPPTVGQLPVEDPTIHQERNEDFRKETVQDPEPQADVAGPSEADTEPGGEPEQTIGALPVEDPTIQHPVETDEEPSPGEEEPGPEPTEDPQDWGQNVKVAMGGYFVMDDLQVFAQYAYVSKPEIQGEPPPMTPGLPITDPSTFHAFGVGFTLFVIPGHDNVKLSSDFQYFLGREMGSSVPASPLNNIQPNDDGSQFFWRIQLSAAF